MTEPKAYKTTEAQRRASDKYRQKNADKVRDRLRDNQRARIVKFKAGRPCKVCGETHPAALDFHHRNPDEKRFSVSRAIVQRDIPDEEIWAEIAKCDVLCRNCHAKLHWDAAPDGGGSGSRKPRGKRHESGQMSLI